MKDARKIWFQDKELGEYSIDQLYRMATRKEIDRTAFFWSEKESAWRPLAGIIFDMQPSSVEAMKAAGIKKVQILGSGFKDCPACRGLQKKSYPIDEVPALPPTDCTCVPWCRCDVIAKA